jgi:metallo-beta-lactamase family protein
LNVTFLGGAGTVTGSKFLVASSGARVLVDCGLFQGLKELRLRNWEPPPIEPRSLDAVVVSHAHIDHSGYLPVLARQGYQGPVYCTPPTRDLLEILLPDSGRIQEEDAAYAIRKGISKHSPARPLYTEADAIAALRLVEPVPFGQRQEVGRTGFRLHPAGHILGAASVALTASEGRLLFSGDLGRGDDPVMRPPSPPPDADWVVVESTYGDRVHPRQDPVLEVAAILNRTLRRGGILLVPSFAVGRTQALLYCLHEIFERRLAPRVPVFVNSPMATDATRLYRRWHEYHRLDERTVRAVCAVATYVQSVEESRRLNESREPCVIISASGMATGGRVLHHLRALLPGARNTVLLPGVQAPGARGAALAAGAGSVKIHGTYVPVHAEVVRLGMFSAHADQHGLVAWLRSVPGTPQRVFVVHGEPGAADALRVRVRDEVACPVSVPRHLDCVELG